MLRRFPFGACTRAALGVALLSGCKEVADEVEDVVSSDVTGQVTDNRGQAVPGATIRLYNLLENTDFVEGGDLTSLEAYIDKEAVLASNNSVATAQTGAD